jgi:hypothetical protein
MRDLVGLTAQIPDDSKMCELRPWVGRLMEEAKAGVSPERAQEIVDLLMTNNATAGVASALNSSIRDSNSLAMCLQFILDFWANKGQTADAGTVKSSAGLKRNMNQDEQDVWDLINRS